MKQRYKAVIMLTTAFLTLSCSTTPRTIKPKVDYIEPGLTEATQHKGAWITLKFGSSQYGGVSPRLSSVDKSPIYHPEKKFTNKHLIKPGQRTLNFYTKVRSNVVADFNKFHSITYDFKTGHRYTIMPDARPKAIVWHRAHPKMIIIDDTLGKEVARVWGTAER